MALIICRIADLRHLKRFLIRWNHLMSRKSRKTNNLGRLIRYNRIAALWAGSWTFSDHKKVRHGPSLDQTNQYGFSIFRRPSSVDGEWPPVHAPIAKPLAHWFYGSGCDID